jgi:hypothetical protein
VDGESTYENAWEEDEKAKALHLPSAEPKGMETRKRATRHQKRSF